MDLGERSVASTSELLGAAGDPRIRCITVQADLVGARSLRLSPGQKLKAAAPGIVLRFAPGEDGIQISADNRVEGLELHTDLDRCAILNDTSVESLGRVVLRNLRVAGAVRILVRDKLRAGHLEAETIDIVAANARGYEARPRGYGVEAMTGAFTLWNQQDDPRSTVTAELIGLSAGRAGAPVRGSGIFVAGGGESGGRLVIHRLETGAIHSDGGIAPGTPDRISGGVFVVSGAFVDQVRNRGAVTTYGANDMVLDNWGSVDQWTVEEKITSHGPSGIGFVNFGVLNLLQVKAPIETFGQGARGFNLYSGALTSAEFERIVTHGDGAVGVQISRPVGQITVRRGIETYGGTGDSLVKGVVVKLSAIALSIKPGGSARQVDIGGGVVTHGEGINPLELHGTVDSLQVSGGFAATGGGFENI